MRLGSLHLCVSEVLSVLVGRYFGSAEGSKFVEMASVDNVKRTWVNYMVQPRSGVTPHRDRWEGGGVVTTRVCELMHQKIKTYFCGS